MLEYVKRATMMRTLLYGLSLLLVSCSARFPFAEVASPPVSNKKAPVWVIAGELHSDIVVETNWLVKHGCRLPESVKSYKYLCLGWGDRIAYTERWGAKDIPRALFWESESIVQIVAFNTEIIPTFPENTVVKSLVPETNGKALSNFFNHSFKFASPNAVEPITLQPSKWGHGYFISSPYSYYAPRMCNQWVATALMEAGIYTTKPSVVLSSGILTRQMKKYNDNQQLNR